MDSSADRGREGALGPGGSRGGANKGVLDGRR